MASEPKETTVKVKLLRATWNGDERQDVGTIIEVPIQAALWGVYENMFAPAGESPFKKA